MVVDCCCCICVGSVSVSVAADAAVAVVVSSVGRTTSMEGLPLLPLPVC